MPEGFPCHMRELSSIIHQAKAHCRAGSPLSLTLLHFGALMLFSQAVLMPFAITSSSSPVKVAVFCISSNSICFFLHGESKKAKKFWHLLKRTWSSQFPASLRTLMNKILVFCHNPTRSVFSIQLLLGLTFLSNKTRLISVLES